MIRGLDQFERALQNVAEQLKGEKLRNAAIKAVQPLIKAAASRAPRGSGALSRSMTTQVISSANAQETILRVGPGRPEGSHGILLEVGTVYMTARPFLASAYEATRQETLDIFNNVMEAEFVDSLEIQGLKNG